MTTHTFDTKLPIPLKQAVIDGVLARLAPLTRANGGYVAALKHTAIAVKGAHDAENVGLLWDVIQGQTPAIAVSLGDMAFEPAGVGGFQYNASLDLHVYLLVNSLRSRETRQTGDVVSAASATADPGLFVVDEHVQQLLIGATLKLPYVKGIRPTRVEELDSENDLFLWQQVYTVPLARTIDPDRDVRQLLNEIHTYARIVNDPARVVISEQNSEMDDP